MAQTSHGHAQLRRDIQEIRLISLLPGQWNDHITCVTQVISLHQSPPYEALSYAWGISVASNPILLDGIPFRITSSLESALRHLRHHRARRILWIDSLCINQTDHEEKAWQVNLMGAIFERCSKGLMWLGSQSEYSDIFCEGSGEILSPNSVCTPRIEAKSLRSDMRKVLTLFEDLSQDQHLQENIFFQGLLESQGNEYAQATESLSALDAFLRRPWWNRAWTVQEAILPAEVVVLCGFLEIPWQTIAKARANWLRHSSSCCFAVKAEIHRLVGTSATAILARWTRSIHAIESYRMGRVRNAKKDLVEVLNTFGSRDAKDPRDKVYAFLGLLPEHERPVFPDYSANIDQLSKSLTLKLFVSSKEPLSVFNGVRRPRSNPRLPSWVRDFGVSSDIERMWFERNRDTLRKNYRASELTAARVQACSDRSLSSVGIKIDDISQIGSIFQDNTSLDIDCIRQWLEMLNLHKRQEEPYLTGGTFREAMARTIVGNFVVTMFPPESLRPGLLGLYRKISSEEIDEYASYLFAVALDPSSNAVHKFDREAVSHLAGRRLFITQGGYIGIGPPHILPGDAVFVLFGGGSPYVLHPVSDGVDSASASYCKSLSYYSLIGDCYVHGIMDGKAIDDATKESLVFLV